MCRVDAFVGRVCGDTDVEKPCSCWVHTIKMIMSISLSSIPVLQAQNLVEGDNGQVSAMDNVLELAS
ncbi:hypothetical protein QVD17_35408 [Tagetes erecta]|uniref:Uncharacterized protein n=1 Tax=Tagetes erecta TaxID=13708 RepID=A0AAD8JZW4_TARER|nr:hypothetical protein QVD17_35408 [Tagetes erecta]